MGIQDRDYWKERYDERMGVRKTGQAQASTHWREDGLRHSGMSPSNPSEHYGSELTLQFWSKVIAFVAIVVVALLGFRAWSEYKVRRDLETFAQQAEADFRNQQRISEQQARASSDRIQAENAAIQQRKNQIYAEREAAYQREQAEARAAVRREKAWKAFYKQSPACQRDAATVECANEHIRFRRAFDASYRE